MPRALVGAQDFYDGCNLVHLGHQFTLVFGHVRFRIIQKQLIVLMHGESAAVNQEDNQDNGETTP